jgi:cellulose synthase/poly-beta-1,6-N-acetylglucosamine synthase-like glycosyltransferase
MNLLDLFLLTTLITTAFVYLGYPFILLIVSFINPSHRKNHNQNPLPKISVIVPTYNEGLVISSKLESLIGTPYPKDLCEIIVVDSGSTDNTCEIVTKFRDKGVTLLKQEKRLGKASAINFALKQANGEIMFISDANAKFQPTLLSEMIKEFDETTGAVLPRLIPSGKLSLWDMLFYKVHHIYKTLESNSDSVFLVFGELFAFRKALVPRIDEDVASDDLAIAFIVRRRNYKIRYAPDLKVVENIPSSAEETNVQRRRRAFGIIQVMKKNIDLLFNPKYRSYGLIIFPTHFMQMTVQPFLTFCLLLAFIMKILVLIPFMNQMVIAYFLILVFFSLLFFTLTKAKQIVLVGYNFLVTQFSIILALFDLMRGKSYRIWKKVSSTRIES